MSLTSTHEDYIEAIYRRMAKDGEQKGVRVSDLAVDLGCRMPTVTRTVRYLSREGFLEHETRGLIKLSRKGRRMAEEIAHRHDDVVAFLHLILGLSREQAEADACQIEHGLSPIAAERLHAFLNFFEELPNRQRTAMRNRIAKSKEAAASFAHLVEVRGSGWRG